MATSTHRTKAKSTPSKPGLFRRISGDGPRWKQALRWFAVLVVLGLLGGALLFDAVLKAVRSEVAMHAMIVEAKDASVEAFYRHHGFATYGSAPGLLIAPLHVLEKLAGE